MVLSLAILVLIGVEEYLYFRRGRPLWSDIFLPIICNLFQGAESKLVKASII
jgi:hypothetical protein